MSLFILVSSKNISCINFILYIIQTAIITVGNNRLALSLELCKIIHDLAAEECATVFKCRLIDNYLGSLCLDTLHDALDGGLAEIVAV